jgi:glycerophosphoryl diester phosphodiesterase
MHRANTSPLVIAHRGDSAHCPENTAAAFESALRAPIDGIELDLRLTADGEVVVCHDADLRRFGGGGSPVVRQNSAALRSQDIGSWFAPRFSSQRLLTLGELLDRYARKTTLLLELKPQGGGKRQASNKKLCARVVRELDRRKLTARVRILCFDAAILSLIGALDERLALVRNHERVPRAIGRWLDAQSGHHGFCCDQRALGGRARAYVDAVHERGQRMYSYTCNAAAAVNRAIAAGVDGVLGDDPFWLAKSVRGRRR